MIDKEIQKALNTQINHEMAAAYNYMAMAAHFEEQNLTGFASWMRVQRMEELEHAAKLVQFLLDRGGSLDLAAVAKPKTDYKTPLEVFETALKQEQTNTRTIHELYKLAQDKGDYATQSFLQWFIDEQVEEEKIMDEVISLLKFAGDDRSAVLTLNQQLGQRPADGEGDAGPA